MGKIKVLGEKKNIGEKGKIYLVGPQTPHTQIHTQVKWVKKWVKVDI